MCINYSGKVQCVSIQPSNVPAGPIEEWRALLTRLPGVFAAGIRTNGDGAINEIHVLASSSRNPKQMARDIQSALLAAFDLEVDHRIISIAQLSGDPTGSSSAQPSEIMNNRLRYKGSSFSGEDGRYTIRVILSNNGKDFSGTATCRDSASLRLRAIAEATLNAVHGYVGIEDLYTLVAVQTIEIAASPLVICLVEYNGNHEGCTLVGAAETVENETIGVVKATLDAINRSIGRLTGEDGIS
jgi:hypothetical protein